MCFQNPVVVKIPILIRHRKKLSYLVGASEKKKNERKRGKRKRQHLLLKEKKTQEQNKPPSLKIYLNLHNSES